MRLDEFAIDTRNSKLPRKAVGPGLQLKARGDGQHGREVRLIVERRKRMSAQPCQQPRLMGLHLRRKRPESRERAALTRKRRDVLGALEHNALRHALRAQLLMCDFADLDRIAAAAGSLALALERLGGGAQLRELLQPLARRGFAEDRKSTRLNSSHVKI